MLIESHQWLAVGTIGSLRLQLGGQQYLDDVEVVRCQPIQGNSVCHVGVRFLLTTARHEPSIRHAVTRFGAELAGVPNKTRVMYRPRRSLPRDLMRRTTRPIVSAPRPGDRLSRSLFGETPRNLDELPLSSSHGDLSTTSHDHPLLACFARLCLVRRGDASLPRQNFCPDQTSHLPGTRHEGVQRTLWPSVLRPFPVSPSNQSITRLLQT